MTNPRPANVRSALVLVFANRYSGLAISFVSIIILARLLTPAQTGLFSVAASVVLLAQSIRDFGIGEFLVQEKELTSAKIRTAFGMTLILSWSLGLLIFFSRGLIAKLYGTPELSALIAIVCGSFAVAPFSSTVLALLNRNLAFGIMLRITLLSNIANASVSLLLAYWGWGAKALTFGMLAANVTTALVASLSARSMDHFIPSLQEWRRLASFGAYMSSTNILNQVGARAPDLIIGRLLGYGPLGLYNRAAGIVTMFNDMVVSSVQAVAFPAFSRAHRNSEDVREPYLRALTLITGAVLPVLALLAVLALPLVQALLGSQWLAAAPLVPLICAGAAFESLAPMVTPILSATGWVRMVLRIALSLRATQVALVAFLSNFDITWIAAGQIVYGLVAFLVNARYLRRCMGLQMGALLWASRQSALVALPTALVPALALSLLTPAQNPAWFSLALGLSLGGICWFAAMFGLRHPLRGELQSMLAEAVAMIRRPAQPPA